MNLFKTHVLLVSMIVTTVIYPCAVVAQDPHPIIEVVTLKIKEGVSPTQFQQVDRDIQVNYISKRQGFLSRESAPGADHTWLVIVHWRSVADAQASMESFSKAAASAQFMSMVEPNSMVMTRYGW